MSVTCSDRWPVFNLCFIRDYHVDDHLFVVVELASALDRSSNTWPNRSEQTKIVCRQVMAQQPDLPAFPYRPVKGQIGVLLSHSRYSDPAFHLMLDKFELKEIWASPANPSQVEQCWENWINVHVSAQWPAVAGLLVDRRNFLEPQDEQLPLKCVRLTIHSAGNSVPDTAIKDVSLLTWSCSMQLRDSCPNWGNSTVACGTWRSGRRC